MAWDAAREKSQGAFGYHAEEATDVQDAILDLMHDVLIDSDLDAAPRLLEIERWVEARSRPMFTPTWAGLARKTARTPRFADQAVLYAQRSCSNEWADAAERADSKIGTHVAAARALLSHDPQEAFAHLERAVEVAGLLGDEAPLRWEALRSLARASDDGSRWPELAYRFARAGEFASAYMEEYFNWGHAVTAIAGLDALTSVAVVGRWRDRGVGPPFKSLLESLERTLRERSVLNPSVSVSFLGFSEDWPLGEMMEAALATSSPAARPAVVAAFARHLDLRSGPRRIWRDLLAVARRHGADGRAFQTGLNRLPRDDRPGRSARYRPSSAWKTGFSKRLSLEPIRTPADAFTRLETQAAVTRVFDRQIAWTLMLASISPERVADFLSELLVSADLPAHSILTVIEALPDAVRRRLAVRQALQQAGLTLARRRWRQFRHGESGGLTPARFAEATGLETGEVIAAMLDGVAAEPGLASPQDLFELVPHIASRLDPRQAADALSHGVGLIEAVMPPAFGDGGWSLAVEPPTDMAEAIGNLLWGALSSPLEATRWEAAHAVRLLFDLDCGEVLNSLAARLEASTPGPCASPSRPFYRLNAELWCLLAVARACRDHPERAASFLRCIERAAAAANDHVLIRRTAASALLSLADAGWLDMTPDARSRLVAIDAPDRAPRIVDTFITGGDWYSQKHRKNGHFRFDYERAKGDALALANAFGLGADRVEKLAEDVVLQVWREPYNSKAPDPRDNDPAWSRRGRGRAFQGYREYLGLHAMLTVAGQLARTRQPLRHRSATRDDFTDWLRRFDLTRRDGTWLSDRLNPAPPLTRPDCPDPALWRWSVTRRDLEGWWNPTPTECVVAAEWIQAEGGREQTVRINSALVAPGTAAAMMAACQTASNAWDYYIPSADQDEINQEPFHVRGWIEDHRVERGLDAGDPWTSAMATSPLRPAAWIARRFRLRADPLEQTWRSRRTAPPTFRADLWATHGDLVRDHQGPNGQRLMVRKTELLRMMRRLRRDLLIEVQMSRLLDGRYGESDDAGPFSPRSSFLLLLFRQDGSVETAC